MIVSHLQFITAALGIQELSRPKAPFKRKKQIVKMYFLLIMPIYLSLQGFIIQARAAGRPLPVGEFQGSLPSNQTYMRCSGGEPQVHSNRKITR